MKLCKCGCFITKHSISKTLCDGCYYKYHRARDEHTETYHALRYKKMDRMATMKKVD